MVTAENAPSVEAWQNTITELFQVPAVGVTTIRVPTTAADVLFPFTVLLDDGVEPPPALTWGSFQGKGRKTGYLAVNEAAALSFIKQVPTAYLGIDSVCMRVRAIGDAKLFCMDTPTKAETIRRLDTYLAQKGHSTHTWQEPGESFVYVLAKGRVARILTRVAKSSSGFIGFLAAKLTEVDVDAILMKRSAEKKKSKRGRTSVPAPLTAEEIFKRGFENSSDSDSDE